MLNRGDHFERFYYDEISELKLTLEEEEMSPYLDHFDTGVKDDVVMLGSISLDEVQEEEKHLRDEHIQYLEQEVGRVTFYCRSFQNNKCLDQLSLSLLLTTQEGYMDSVDQDQTA